MPGTAAAGPRDCRRPPGPKVSAVAALRRASFVFQWRLRVAGWRRAPAAVHGSHLNVPKATGFLMHCRTAWNAIAQRRPNYAAPRRGDRRRDVAPELRSGRAGGACDGEAFRVLANGARKGISRASFNRCSRELACERFSSGFLAGAGSRIRAASGLDGAGAGTIWRNLRPPGFGSLMYAARRCALREQVGTRLSPVSSPSSISFFMCFPRFMMWPSLCCIPNLSHESLAGSGG